MAEEAVPHGRIILSKLTTFPALCGMLLIVEVWATLPLYIHDPDTWWHIAVGTRILQTHVWPTHDIYSFTAFGNPWISDEWIGEILMALAAHSGPVLAALAWLRVALGASLLLLLFYYAYLRCRNFTTAFLACAAIYGLAYGFFTLRPQLLGYIFLLITLIFLERFRLKRQKSLWLLPVLFLIWVNTHGMFPLGLGVIALYWASGLREWRFGELEMRRWTTKERHHLAIVLLLCFLVVPITPYGSESPALVLYRSFFDPFTVAHIGEWQPIGFAHVWSRAALVLVLLFFVGVLVFRPKWRLEEIAMLAFAFYGACIHRRMFLLFVVVFAPMLAAMLAQFVPDFGLRRNRAALNASLMVLLAVGMLEFFPSHKRLAYPVDQMYPVKAVQYLERHRVPGPMFNEYLWGGYLIWKLGPRHRVFIDGRTDLYDPAGVFADYVHIVWLTRQTLFLLRKYSIRSCLLKTGSPLATLLAGMPSWHCVYRDKVSALYVHESSASSSDPIDPRPSAQLGRSSAAEKTNRHFQLLPAAE